MTTKKGGKMKLRKEQRESMAKMSQKEKKLYLRELKERDPKLAFEMKLKRLWEVARK